MAMPIDTKSPGSQLYIFATLLLTKCFLTNNLYDAFAIFLSWPRVREFNLLKKPSGLRPDTPTTILNYSIKSPRCLPLFNEKRSTWHSRRQYDLLPCLPAILVANCFTRSKQAASMLVKYDQVCTQCSEWGHTMASCRVVNTEISLNSSPPDFWASPVYWSFHLNVT